MDSRPEILGDFARRSRRGGLAITNHRGELRRAALTKRKIQMLPEDILKDDVEALREEQDALYEKYLAEDQAIRQEIYTRLAEAKAAGFNAETW